MTAIYDENTRDLKMVEEKEDYADKLERKFKELIERTRKDKEKKDPKWRLGEFSAKVCPHHEDKRRAYRHLLGPQRITLADAYRLVNALEEEFAEFLFNVKFELRIEEKKLKSAN